MPIVDLSSRWKSERAPDLDSLFRTMNSFQNAASTKKAALSADGRLTPLGVGEQLRNWAGKGYARELKRAEKFVAEQCAALAERRRKLGEPVIDRSDAIGAAQRKEVRDYLRSVPIGERAKLILSDDADPIFALAALELPALSGLDSALLDQARRVYVTRTAGDVPAQLDDREEALTCLGAAVDIAKIDLRANVEPPAGQSFDAWFAELDS